MHDPMAISLESSAGVAPATRYTTSTLKTGLS